MPELALKPQGTYICSQSSLFPSMTAEPIDARHGFTNAYMLTYVKHLQRIAWVHKVYLWEKGLVPYNCTWMQSRP